MANTETLAVRYRPHDWDSLIGQDTMKAILQEQLSTNTFKQVYLFTGPSGDGKTTTARIFANKINHGKGNPIEVDASSHNSVEDVREIIQQAKTQSLDSEYKIYILDEVHSFSNNAWQAMLKLIEEPPEKTVFIFCTTNPEKIPKTILSRTQRYDFSRISNKDISTRLAYILQSELHRDLSADDDEAIQYLARIADGGMRTAISYLDKCLSYNDNLSIETVIKALGIANYDVMFSLFDSLYSKNSTMVIEHIESLHQSGIDLKQFIRSFIDFLLDICKYGFTDDFSTLKIPNTYEVELKAYTDDHFNYATDLLSAVMRINSDIKWDANPKSMIEAELLLFVGRNNE